MLYPIKDRFYGSLRSTNRPSVSLAPHPRRHMVVTHRCVSPCGNGGFMHFTIKRQGESGVGKKSARERTGLRGTCKRKPWNRDERNQRHIKLFARQTWLNIPPLPFLLPRAFLLGFITQLIRQMHDRYRAPSARELLPPSNNPANIVS